MRQVWSKLSFRRQLTAIIAGVLLVGGVVLLLTQYLVLQALLSEAVTVQNEQIRDSSEVTGGGPTTTDPSIMVEQHGPRWSQGDPVVSGVLQGVQIWSGVLLLVFTVLAIGCAWLVSRQAMSRIAKVTDATNAITEHDLSQRLDLAGPDDEIKRLGTAIDAMVERLEAAFVRQESFIANASHEFRTPLATARMAMQLALRENRVPPDLLPDLEDVLDANRRLEDLVDALLVVAQGRAGADLPQHGVDLVALLEEVGTEHSAEVERAELTLEITTPETAVPVRANESLLRSLVSNLVVNAIRHNVVGGFISIEITLSDGQAQLVIANSGPVEFDASMVQRLAEPFQRGDRSRLRNDDGSEAGTGLGLAISRQLAELMGGSIDLSARAGGGLSVMLTLPAWSAEPGSE